VDWVRTSGKKSIDSSLLR